MRINKYLAGCGFCSRRKAEELVLSGKVSVNGKVCTDLATIISQSDKVLCGGAPAKLETEKIYIMLNKPEGYITSLSDEKGRSTVMELLTGIDARVYPVGRLDYSTKGLLLLTNDGDFDYKLTHPKNEIDKVYTVVYDSPLSATEKQKLRDGLVLDGAKTAKAALGVEKKLKGSLRNVYSINVTIHEGRNRQVRRMFEAIGKKVLELTRIQIGGLKLGDLKTGQYTVLTQEEIGKI